MGIHYQPSSFSTEVSPSKWESSSACKEETERISLHISFFKKNLGKKQEETRVHVCTSGNVKMKSLHSQAHIHTLCTTFIFTVYPENYCQVAFPSSSTPWLILLLF